MSAKWGAADAERYNHREGNDDYTQPGNLFRLFNDEQKQRLFNNIADAMFGQWEIVKLLEEYGAKPDSGYRQGMLPYIANNFSKLRRFLSMNS